jgi:YD repeat-containing protein
MDAREMMNLKHSYKSIFYVSFAAIIALCATALPAYAGFENVSLRYDVPTPRKMDLSYDVYAGGFKALDATLELDLDKKAYDMSIEAKTQGFIGNLFPWKATYSTSGHAEKGELIPTMHLARSSWRNKEKLTEMDYDPQGNLLKTTVQENGKTTTNRDIESDMVRDSVDMLTGALLMMQNAKNTAQCKGSFPVYDGKRRFNLTLKDEGTEMIKKSDYSSFEGKALRCTIEVEPVAGFKEKDKQRGWMAVQAHTEERKKLPTLWLAQLEKDGPAVPVRMEIASAYGSVVAHLSSARKE